MEPDKNMSARLSQQRDEAVADALDLRLAYVRLESMVKRLLPSIKHLDKFAWFDNEYVDLTVDIDVHTIFKIQEVLRMNDEELNTRGR